MYDERQLSCSIPETSRWPRASQDVAIDDRWHVRCGIKVEYSLQFFFSETTSLVSVLFTEI